VNVISVVIADSKKAARASYLKQLEQERGIHVIGEAGTKREVMKALRLKPRILLLDWKIVAMRETLLLPIVRRHSPETQVILLASRIPPMRLIQAMAHGVRGHLERAHARSLLIKAVQVVDGEEAWVSRAMVPLLLTSLRRVALREW
jgi:DNA-binding NarL/FixJ family response regulator